MKSSLAKMANEGREIYTLAQKGTGDKGKVLQIGEIVRGEGTQLSNHIQLKKWARKKVISQKAMLALIEIAELKGANKRVKAYWNTYYCFTNVISSGDRLYGHYCKNRFCPICKGIYKANVLNKYLPTLKEWVDLTLVTLTVKSPFAIDLNKRIDEMYEVLKRILKKYGARNKRGKGFRFMGLRSLECNFNPRYKTYNPHFHILVPSRAIAKILRAEWIQEGRKKWGYYSISERAQNCRTTKGVIKDIIEVVKYTAKFFNPTKGTNEPPMFYAAAYDNIVAALDDRRVFERFGFNLPQQENKLSKKTHVEHFKKWGFIWSESDWLEEEGALLLSNYITPKNLVKLLNENIDLKLK